MIQKKLPILGIEEGESSNILQTLKGYWDIINNFM